jgi:excisionase family DNA binding protein
MSDEPARLGLDLEPLVAVIAQRVVEALGERPANEPYLTVEESAEVLRCKPKRIYELAAARRLKHRRDGRRLLFRREDLDAALETVEAKP